MKRHRITPRPDWQAKVEEIGLAYHSHEDSPYWDESAYYYFTSADITQFEEAARTLHKLCIDAAEAIIQNDWWDRLSIPKAAIPIIKASWERDDFSLYGRFDVAYDGSGPPKLLEYNADTPTALVEASVGQWFWLQERFPKRDQFNSLHERLIASWKTLEGERVHFASFKDQPEDEQTVLYLQDTCHQAGLVTKRTAIEDLGWNEKRNAFVDLENQRISCCFKLYPWEWMWSDEFAMYLPQEPCRFIEPAWKMLLSNKGILPVLWELFSGHPNLLPAFESPEPLEGSYVQKPKLGREGANIQRLERGQITEQTAGDYDSEDVIYQDLAPLADFDGNYPVLGLWIVNHEPAGLGIREDASRITTNLSRFVPHLF
jgi:glutathionylspermidine synthase